MVILLQILVKAVPIKEGHMLRIIWPVTPNIRYYKESPSRYLSHLIGHEGVGSLFYVLKSLGELTWFHLIVCRIPSCHVIIYCSLLFVFHDKTMLALNACYYIWSG